MRVNMPTIWRLPACVTAKGSGKCSIACDRGCSTFSNFRGRRHAIRAIVKEVPQCFHFRGTAVARSHQSDRCRRAGCNAVNTMITGGLCRVDFVAANTDDAGARPVAGFVQNSNRPGAHVVWVRAHKPEVGRDAALESKDEIREPGRRGHGVCDRRHGRWHRDRRCSDRGEHRAGTGILTVAVVTKPFQYEGIAG